MTSAGNPSSKRDADQDPRERIVPGDVDEASRSQSSADEFYPAGPAIEPAHAQGGTSEEEFYPAGPAVEPNRPQGGLGGDEFYPAGPAIEPAQAQDAADDEFYPAGPPAGGSATPAKEGSPDTTRGKRRRSRKPWIWSAVAACALAVTGTFFYRMDRGSSGNQEMPPVDTGSHPARATVSEPEPETVSASPRKDAGATVPVANGAVPEVAQSSAVLSSAPGTELATAVELPIIQGDPTPDELTNLKQAWDRLRNTTTTRRDWVGLQEWANKSRSATQDPDVQQMILIIDALNDTTIPDLDPRPTEQNVNPGRQTKTENLNRSTAIPFVWTRSHISPILAVLMLTAADVGEDENEPKWVPPQGMSPEDEKIWRGLIEELRRGGNPLRLAKAELALAKICLKRWEFDKGVENCLSALDRVKKALEAGAKDSEYLLEHQSRLQQLHAKLVHHQVKQLGEQSKQLAGEVGKASAQSKASQQAAQQAMTAWQAMASAQVEQLLERLRAIQQRTSDKEVLSHAASGEARSRLLLEQVHRGDAAASFADEYARLARGILQVESRLAASEIVGAVVTRPYVESVLNRIQLPTVKELGQAEEPAPNDSWTKLLRNAQGEVDWLRKQIEAVDQREFSPDQAQEVRRRLQDVIYDALRLETRKQIAALPRSPTGQPLPPDLVTEERLRTEVKNLQQAIASAAEPLRGELQTQSQNLKETITSGDANVREEVRSSLAKLESDLNDKSDELATQVSLTSQKVERLEARLGGVLTGAQSIPAPNATVASQQYSAGCAAYFSGDMERALTCFLSAVEYQRSNPAYRYYLGLTFKQLGREEEAVNQVRMGRMCEERYPRISVGRCLERIQGPNRQWLEWYRMAL